MDLEFIEELKKMPVEKYSTAKLASDISNLTKNHTEMVMLIIIDYNINHSGRNEAMPYNSILAISDNGIKFSKIDSLPRKLLDLIHNYIQSAIEKNKLKYKSKK